MHTAFDASYQVRFQAFLLEDDLRLDTWRRGVHATVKPGDVVLDLGAGMGILSLFAVEAGAKKVYAVEPALSARLARIVVEANGLADTIEVIPSFSQRIELPELADSLITDTLETFGLNGRMLSAMADARPRLCKPGARLAPRRMRLYCAPIRAPEVHGQMIEIWTAGTTGFDLTAGRSYAANNMYPVRIAADDFLAEPEVWTTVDMTTLETPAASGSAELTVTTAGEAHGIGGFFAAEIGGEVVITNDPRTPTVTYRHALLPFDAPLALEPSDRLTIAIDSYDGVEWRWQVELHRAAGGDPERLEGATLHGMPLDAAALRVGSPSSAPARSRRGEAELFVLSALDGTRTLAEIQTDLSAHFGDVLHTESDMAQLVRDVASRASA